MSDSSSLFSNLSKDSAFFLNIDLKLCAILLCIILFCIFTMSSTVIFTPSPIRSYKYYENFSNNDFYSYKNMDYSNYTSIPLTALNVSDIDKTPSNLMSGGANRIISTDASGDTFYTVDMNANLYVLGGQVYDDSSNKKIIQNYNVILMNPKNNKIFRLGNLQKSGDGMYKLNYKLNIKNIPPEIGNINDLTEFNVVKIMYTANDETGKVLQNSIILQGNF